MTGTVPAKPLSEMSDRELLHHLADAVATYDSDRDAELEYLEDNPVRDAWSPDQEEAYRELVSAVWDQHATVAAIITHIRHGRPIA